MNFQNKLVLITGGSSGIGLATARKFAALGARIVLVNRSKDHLEAAVNTLPACESGEHLTISTDVTDPLQVAQAIEIIQQSAGAPDILINSAGVAHPGYIQELPAEIFHWMMDVNYFGSVNMVKAVLPDMIARRSGHVVNICSTAGFLGIYGYSAYGASKFALRGFTDSLRLELKSYNIGVSIVYPTDTDTPQLAYENLYKPVEYKALEELVGIAVLPPERIAESIVHGVLRKKYVIIADPGTRILYWLAGHFGDGQYFIMDFLMSKARKRIKK